MQTRRAFRPQWKSDSYEREVEKCSGVENALDDSAIVRVSTAQTSEVLAVLHLSKRPGSIPRGLGRTVDPTAAGGTLVAGSLLEDP